MVKEAAVPSTEQVSSPGEVLSGRPSLEELAVKCPKCKEILYTRDWKKNLKVCQRCNYHFKLSAPERIAMLVDPGSFHELDADMVSVDPLRFTIRTQTYKSQLEEKRQAVGMNEALLSGHGTIDHMPITLAIMDFRFMGGSMGSVVGEKITRAIEYSIEQRSPILIASTSGGARMQEGLYSLMQMAKTSAALAKLGEAGVPYYSLITDPTSGGVTASFATLGDVIIGEPGAFLAFAGPRVVEQFMHVKVPEGTINSEFALQHGMIDAVVHRRDLRQTLSRLLRLYMPTTRRSPAR